MTDSKPKQKALCVATRCTSVEQFVSTFHRFCDDSTFFVATLATRPVGLETAFSIELEDKTPVLRGLCSVVEAWSTPANRFGRPGVRLAVKRLTNESLVVFKQLQTARKAAEAADGTTPPATTAAAATGTSPPATRPADPGVSPPAEPDAPETTPAAKPVESPASTAARPSPPKLPPLRPIPNATPPAFPVLRPAAPRSPTPPPPGVAMIPPIAARAEPPAPSPAATAPEPPAPSAPEPAAFATPEPAAFATPEPYVPEPIAASDDLTNPVATETRTPGSSFVLPANPLMNLTDQSLGGFVDCALYEETGNFFRAPDYEDSLVDIDDPIAPPPARPGPRTLAPVPALRPGGLSPTAFVPASPDDDAFAPEATPLPFLAGLAPARAHTDPPIPPTPPAGRAPTPPVFDDRAEMFTPRGYGSTALPHYPAPAPPLAMTPNVPATPRAAPPAFDNTATLIALNRKRDRKRWLVIGGTAAGVSLLLLVIVLASSGGGGNKDASAATPPTTGPATPPGKPSVARTPDAPVETPAKPSPPVGDPPDEPVTDPNAPPVVGTGPCRVTVTSSPAGSMVHLDDQQFGPSPITIDGPCAKRRIDVKHPRYALGTKWVVLAAGKPTSVDLALARPTHTVTVTSIPPGATVSIAGRRAGTTPTAVKVMGFTGVTLTVEKKGWKTETQKLYSKVDGDKVNVKLVRGK